MATTLNFQFKVKRKNRGKNSKLILTTVPGAGYTPQSQDSYLEFGPIGDDVVAQITPNQVITVAMTFN